MKFKKGKLGVLSILLVLALALTGCGGQKADNASKKADSEKQLTKVRLQLKWLPQTQFAGYYVAQEKQEVRFLKSVVKVVSTYLLRMDLEWK